MSSHHSASICFSPSIDRDDRYIPPVVQQHAESCWPNNDITKPRKLINANKNVHKVEQNAYSVLGISAVGPVGSVVIATLSENTQENTAALCNLS